MKLAAFGDIIYLPLEGLGSQATAFLLPRSWHKPRQNKMSEFKFTKRKWPNLQFLHLRYQDASVHSIIGLTLNFITESIWAHFHGDQ